MKLEFSQQIFFFSKNTRIPNFMKIRPDGTEFFHADGRIDGDMTELIVAFCNFANAHEKDFMFVTHWLHVLVFHAFASDSPYIIFRLL